MAEGFDVHPEAHPPELEIYECTDCGALVLDKSRHEEFFLARGGPQHNSFNAIEFTRQERVVEIALVRRDQ